MGRVQHMVSSAQCLLCLLLHYASGSLVMLPVKDTEEDMAHTIRTGRIPDQLLRDILEEAGQFMYLFKHNPSSFLTSENLMTKRKGPFKKKKRPEGIVSLTRPRFGKRSSEVVGSVPHVPDLGPGSPIYRAVYLYLLQNYGIPIENKALRSQSETFSKLTRPRFGKRSHVVPVYPEHENDNVNPKENLLIFEQKESED